MNNTYINFGEVADGVLLDSLLPAAIFVPEQLKPVSKVIEGALTWPAYQTPGSMSGIIVLDSGSADRRIRTLVAMRSSIIIAALANDDGSWLGYMITLSRRGNGYGLSSQVMRFDAEGRILSYNEDSMHEYGANFTNAIFDEAGSAEDLALLQIDVRADGSYIVYVDGKAQHTWDGPSDRIAEKLPPAMTGTHLWGFTSLGSNDGMSLIRSIDVSTFENITYIKDVKPVRVTDTQSGFKVELYSNNSDVKSFRLTVKTRFGESLLSDVTGIKTGEVTTFVTDAMDANLVDTAVVLHVSTNITNPGQEDDYFTTVPITIAKRELTLGLNWDFFSYWAAATATRDLARTARLGPYYNLPWQQVGERETTARDGGPIGIQLNGLPTKFEDSDSSFGLFFDNWLDPSQHGEYVLDFSQQPGLRPYISISPDMPAGSRSLTLDYFGIGKHKLEVHAYDRSAHWSIDQDYWGLAIFNDSVFADPATLPTQGWTFTCRKVGDLGDKLYTPELHDWWRGLGGVMQRWMTPDGINEMSFNIPDGHYTPEAAMPIDGQYSAIGMGPAIEYKAQLCTDTLGSLYLNIPRCATAAYTSHIVQRALAVSPDLKIVIERTNEPWNYAFPQATMMIVEGLRRGLGKPDAVFGQNDRLPDAEKLPDNGPYPVVAEGERRAWRASIFTRVGTQNVNLDPYIEGSGWTLEQDAGFAGRRYLAELIHADLDALQAVVPEKLGSQIRVTIGTWQNDPSWAEPALTWPAENPLGDRLHGISSAFYFGEQIGQYDNPNAPVSILNASPGLERQAAIVAETRATAEAQLEQWASFQDYVARLNITNGWNLEGMCYEGGLAWTISGPQGHDDTPDNAAWWADFFAAERGDGMRRLYRDMLVAQAEVAGGVICWFDSISFNMSSSYTHRPLGMWAMSNDPTDLDGGRRLGFIDAMKDLGLFRSNKPRLNEEGTITLPEVALSSVRTPATGERTFFIDGDDHLLKRRDSDGMTTVMP